MSDFNIRNDLTGFSTGALERGNYRSALRWLKNNHVNTVELSALRYEELEPLVNDLESLSFDEFSYVSFHAPSSYDSAQEQDVLKLLKKVFERGWNIVVHPDVIYSPNKWSVFGSQLLIENMDRRKKIGRTVEEMRSIFKHIPSARMCLDVAHARQLDATLSLLRKLLKDFRERIAEIHISELDSRCRHVQMSWAAVEDYQMLLYDCKVPIIIESMLEGKSGKARSDELALAQSAFQLDVQ